VPAAHPCLPDDVAVGRLDAAHAASVDASGYRPQRSHCRCGPSRVAERELQRVDEAPDSISGAAAVSHGDAGELSQGEQDDARRLTLHPSGRAVQGSTPLVFSATVSHLIRAPAPLPFRGAAMPLATPCQPRYET
jgi:hypothetical protein